jgi:adenosine deaminase
LIDNTGQDCRLSVSINSDDPLTFASRLADEYAYMHFALLGQGVSNRAALKWLTEARDAAWRSRFTLEASADLSCLAELTRRRRGET